MNSNKFRMVYKVDGNPQLDSRDWSMYSNILTEKSSDHFIDLRNLKFLTNFDVNLTSFPGGVENYVLNV